MQRLRAISFLVLLTLWLVLVPAALSYASTDWHSRRISSASYNAAPAIDGDSVVWQGSPLEGEPLEIFLYDLRTSQLQQLTRNDLLDSAPVTSGPHVAWQAYPLDGGDTSQVYLFDQTGGGVKRLTSGPKPHYNVRLRNGLLAWQDSTDLQRGDIYLHNIARGTTLNVSGGFGDNWNPDLGDRYLVWEQWDGNTWQIAARDVEKGSYQQITSDSYDNWQPRTDGDIVVWNAWDGQNNHVRYYDGRTGETREVSENEILRNDYSYPEDFVQVANGLIVWVERTGKLRLYDTNTNRKFLLNDIADRMPRPFSVSRGFVSWHGSDASFNETVSVVELASNTTIVVDSDTGDIAIPKVSEAKVAWQKGGVENRQIMLAERPSQAFRDVVAEHAKAIAVLSSQGVISGYQVGDEWEFRPDAPVLRAQFAKMICGTLGVPVVEEYEAPFFDLGVDKPDDLYPHQYVATAAERGITRGTGPGVYSPYNEISRAQVITMIVRAVEGMSPRKLKQAPAGYLSSIPWFSDVHSPNLAVAEHNGLLDELRGYDPGWDAWAPATRGEVSQMLFNLLDLLEGGKG